MSVLGETSSGPDRRARRRAIQQLIWLGHALVYVLAILLLTFTTGPVVSMIVALAWAILLGSHGFVAVVAPPLLERLERRAQRALPAPDVVAEVKSGRSLETLAAAIAHEIRNPITAAKSLVQQIAEDPSAATTAEYANVAVAELDRVERSIVHLLRFAREESLELEPVDMCEVVRSAVDTVRDRAAKLGVSVNTSLDRTALIEADREKLRRVVINLLSNSLDALEEAATVGPSITVSTGPNLKGDEIWVSVRDNGPGVAPELLPRIFDPFFTSKENGTGFGLSLARKTIEAHRGTFEAKPVGSGGVELTFVIPRSVTQRSMSSARENMGSVQQGAR